MSKRAIISLLVVALIVGAIIWLVNRRDKENPTPVLSVSAYNQTKDRPATDTNANPQDVIVYTLTADNQNDDVIEGYVMEANISEITSKASLIDASGAAYNSGTNSLVWTPLDIPAHESISKQFSVRINPLPSGTTTSEMKIKFNNELTISVSSTPTTSGSVTTPSPTPIRQAPVSGPAEWLPILLAVLATSGFIAVRKYKLVKI
jgi:hypothetical protein